MNKKQLDKEQLDKEQFNKIMAGNEYRFSWALWRETVDDLTIFREENEPWKKVKDRFVIISLNRASAIGEPYANFHSPNKVHNDKRLMEAFKGTPIEGCLMADVSRDFGSDSNKIGISDEDIKGFFAEIQSFFDHPIVFLIGNKKAYDRINNLIKKGTIALGSNQIARFHGYSSANNGRIVQYYKEHINSAKKVSPDEAYPLVVRHELADFI